MAIKIETYQYNAYLESPLPLGLHSSENFRGTLAFSVKTRLKEIGVWKHNTIKRLPV